MGWHRPSDFKKQFSVGDIITNTTGYPMVITAIGERRFLWRGLGKDCLNTSDERVSTMTNYCSVKPYRIWDPTTFPDNQYFYMFEIEEEHKETRE